MDEEKKFLTAAETEKGHIKDGLPGMLTVTMMFELAFVIYALVKNNRHALEIGIVLGGIPIYLWILICFISLIKWKLTVDKRKLLRERGSVIEGTVEKIITKHIIRRKRILYRYEVVVLYDTEKGPKEWKSQKYAMNPERFFEIDGGCRLLVYGGKMLLDEDQPKELTGHGSGVARKVKWLEQEHMRFVDVLSPNLSSDVRFHMIQDRAELKGSYSHENYVIKYPIENHGNLSPEELVLAKEEWELLAGAVTDCFYRFSAVELKESDGSVPSKVYVEIRYSGDFPEEKKMKDTEKKLLECIWEHSEVWQGKEATLQKEALEGEIRNMMESQLKKVTVSDIFVEVM